MGMACIVPNWNQLRDDCFPMSAMPSRGSAELSFQDLRETLRIEGIPIMFPRVFWVSMGSHRYFVLLPMHFATASIASAKYGDHLRQQKRRKRMASADIKAHEIPSKSRRGLGIYPEGIPT